MMSVFLDDLRRKLDALIKSGRAASVYETVLWEIYRTWIVKPGATVIDIGAHKGLHSFRLAEIVGKSGKVYAFEPTDHLAAQLRTEVAKRGLNDIVEVVSAAVGNTVGSVDFYYSEAYPTQSTIVYDMGKNFSTTARITVPSVTLDHFFGGNLPRKLSFIKIDAEGAETEILSGARQLLGLSNAFLAIEFSFSQLSKLDLTPEGFFLLLQEVNYMVYDLAGREITLADVMIGNYPWTHELILTKIGHWTNDFCADPGKLASITDRIIRRELLKLGLSY
jgi:FkbM family methyltransferase